MIVDIHSNDNPTFKHVKQLLKKKFRDQFEQYIIEGVRIIMDAVENKKKIEYIFFCDDLYNTSGGTQLLQLLTSHSYRIYKISNKMYSEISDTKNPQGIMAVMPFIKHDLEVVSKKKDAFVIILDRIQDPGNLGTILRTADAAGADAVLMTNGCVDLYNLKTIRSTMGSIFHIPIINHKSTEEIIQTLKFYEFKIVSTSLSTQKYYFDINFNKKMAIVIGNEANGIRPEILKASDYIVKIPMVGDTESLNAAVAASIMMYEAVRQRYSQKI